MAYRPDLKLSWPAVAALACVVVLAGETPAVAQPVFDIPAQPLGQALVAFSTAAGEQVIVSPNLVAGRTSRAVNGALAPDAALAKLLAGSGLIAERTPRGVLLIKPAPPPRPPAQPAEPEPAMAEVETQVEELIVTTQRREQPSLDTPMALTTLSGAALQRLGVVEIDQLARFVPGLSVVSGSPASSGFSMRGITQISGDATREPRMSVFQDGLSVSKERGAYFELFDLERVEVAKGPQSTLFGRSAMTGAMNVVQHKAELDNIDSSATVQAGDKGSRSIEAMVNLPLGESAAVRFAGRSRRRDGLTQNLAGGAALDSVATDAARAVFTWRPDSRLRADAILNYQRDQPGGMPLKSLAYAPPGGDLGRFSAPGLSAIDDRGQPQPLGLDRTLASLSLTASYVPAPAWKVTALAGYRRFYANERQDGDGTALPVVSVYEETRGVQFSEELRVNYDAGGRWLGFVGFSGFQESGTQRAPFTIDERLLLARITDRLASPVPQGFEALTDPRLLADELQALAAGKGYALPVVTAAAIAANLKPAYVERNQNFGRTSAYEAFADLTYKLTPRWELSAGLRYSYDAKTSAVAAAQPAGASVLGGALAALAMAEPQRSVLLARLAAPGGPKGPSYGLIFQPTAGYGDKFASRLEDDGWSWRLVSRYAPSADLSLYGSYARGRRPTVLVAGAPAAPGGPARFVVVPSETVDSLELGGKGFLLERRLRLEAAAYTYAYENFQTTRMVDGQLRSLNAGTAAAYGFETQADISLRPGARLSATYAYNHARLTSGAMEGDHFRLAPDHKVSLVLDLWRDTAAGRVSFTPSYSWQSMIFFADDNDRPDLSRGLARDTVQDEMQGPYGLLDLRLSFQPPDRRWEVLAFVTNALDQRYLKEGGFIGESFGFSATAAGPRRLMGLTFTLRH